MPSDATEKVAAFFSAPENQAMIFEWLAELGGDPDQYGYDEIPQTDAQIADAMRNFLRTSGQEGSVAPDIAALAESSDVDWTQVTQAVDTTLLDGLDDL